MTVIRWLGNLVVRVSDLLLNGREFDPRRRTIDRLVLGWVTVFQPPRPTQPPILCGTGNEY